MAVLLRHVDAGLQHKNREGNTRNPRDETDGSEDREQEEDDSAGPVFAREHVKGCGEPENDVQDALIHKLISAILKSTNSTCRMANYTP